MKCPCCNGEMEKGYLEQDLRHALRWYSAKSTGGLFPKREERKLTALWKGGTVTMYHCEICKKFIIDEKDIDV